MQKLAMWKDIFREIWKSKARFLSIFAIILMGVAFFAGLVATGPVMRETANQYFDDNNLMDIQVQSTYGLAEEDMEILENVDNAFVEGKYTVDVLLEEEDSATKLFGYNEEQQTNEYIVTEGRLPEESGEIALDANEEFTETYSIGDRLHINEDTDDNYEENFSQTEFEVVGFVQNPRYIQVGSRGNTTVGSGTLDGFGVIREEDFDVEYFTEANIRFEQTDNINVYSDEYVQFITDEVTELEDQFEVRSEERYEQIQEEAQNEIDQGREELEDAKQQIEEAGQELEEGREDLDAGWEEYQQGQQELNEQRQNIQDEFTSRRQEIGSARTELEESEQELVEAQRQLDLDQEELNQTVYELNLPELERRVETGELELEQGKNRLEQGQLEIDDSRLALEEAETEAQAELQERRQQVESSQAAIEEAKNQLNAGQEELDRVRSQADSAIEQSQSAEGTLEELEAAQAELDSAFEELTVAEEELNSNETELQQALEKIEAQTRVSRTELQETKAELAELTNEQEENNNEEVEETPEETNEDPETDEQEVEETSESEAEAEAESSESEEPAENSNTSDNSENPANSERIEELRDRISVLEQELSGLETEAESINENLLQIENQRENIIPNRDELDTKQQELDQRREQLETILGRVEGRDSQVILEELNSQQEELDQSREEIESREEALIEGKAMLDESEQTAQAEFQNVRDRLREAQAGVDTGFETLNQARTELDAGAAELAGGIAQISSARQQLAAFQTSLDQGRAALVEGMTQLNQGEQTLNEAETQAQEGLSDAQNQLDEGRETLEQGEADYQDGLTAFEEEASTAEEEIAQAEEELRQAEEDLGELEEPSYIVNDHSDLQGTSEFGENANRIDAIATIFPVFFFLLAVLISLTTMTRMVDEERNQIGTMKALGYSNIAIATKYYVYAFIATIVGGIIGLFLGYWLFPSIIMDAYSTMYNLPGANTRWFWSYAVISMFGALIATGLATYFSVRSLLKNNAATLLRPKAPKKGKRIFLERIPFIWNRMSFTQKVSSRNLFRYKGRMFMTIFGVAGGTALLLTGFGLSDSISKVNPIQFDELYQYDATVSKSTEASEDELQSLNETIASHDLVDSQLDIYQGNGTAVSEENELDFALMVPSEAEDFQDFVVLRDHEDEDVVYELPPDGAIITEKLAEMMGVEEGDSITVAENSDEEYEIPVSGVVEHYVGHNIYMSEEAYQNVIEGEMENNTTLLRYGTSDFTEEEQEELGDQISEENAALGIFFQTVADEAFQESLDSLNVVTIVLIVSAGALAFVVLYNLTNINISERIRELSTIKVLGFYDLEVTRYVYRENIVLTIMGILAGFVLGFFMHQFVIATAEVDMMKFVTEMDLTSYLYAAILMLIFSIIVGVVMHFKLKSIDMVEALKTED